MAWVDLAEDKRLGLVGPDGRASCRWGGPHKLEAWLKDAGTGSSPGTRAGTS